MSLIEVKITDIAEAVIIVEAIKELILCLEAKRNEGNSIEIDAAIAYAKLISRKYYTLSKTTVKKDLNGHFVPVATPKN